MAKRSKGSLREFEEKHAHPMEGRTLIVGSQVYGEKEDRRIRYEEAIGVDMLDGPGVDFVVDLEEPLPSYLGMFDHVECMSVLEHSRRPWLLAANIERLMHFGATLFVSVPFCWRVHAYPNDYFRLTPEGVRSLFPNIEWTALMMASDQLREKTKLPGQMIDGYPYLPRTETVGFGFRK